MSELPKDLPIELIEAVHNAFTEKTVLAAARDLGKMVQRGLISQEVAEAILSTAPGLQR